MTESDDQQRIRREQALRDLGADPATPWDVATVEGCDCGGIDTHRAASGNVFGYGCTVWDLPRPEREARIEDAIGRARTWTAEHREDRPDLPDLCCTHGERIDRAVQLLEDLVEARTKKPKLVTCGVRYAVTSVGSTVDHVDCPQPRPCLIHDRPRGYSLADQFNDLIKRHDQLLISDAQFYEHIAEMTGIRYPGNGEIKSVSENYGK